MEIVYTHNKLHSDTIGSSQIGSTVRILSGEHKGCIVLITGETESGKCMVVKLSNGFDASFLPFDTEVIVIPSKLILEV